jgi:transcriptional regulator with XRE-family HTH domain
VALNILQIAARLTLLREALGLNQAAFCREAEIAPNQWNQYETGKRPITLPVAAKLKERYGASLDWIYLGDSAGIPRALFEKLFPAKRKPRREAALPLRAEQNGEDRRR